MGSYILGDILSIKLVIKSTVNSITETVVHVKNTDQIWVLSKYINDDGAQHYFIYNNNIISPAFSFEFHGNKDNTKLASQKELHHKAKVGAHEKYLLPDAVTA